VSNSSKHVPALDGIRGLAVLLVMVDHMQIIWGGTSSWFRAIPELGQHGVDLFFVLSGFLITGILDDGRESKSYFRNFYIRRALRIFPLYYLFLFIAFYLQPRLVHKPDIALGEHSWFWLYLSNFFFASRGWLETSPFNLNLTWSLAIEEQFYIVWPLIVLLFRGQTLRRICLWIICGSVLFRLCVAAMGTGVVAIYVLTPSRLDALAIGAWSVLALRNPPSLRGFYIRNLRPIGNAALAIGIAVSIWGSLVQSSAWAEAIDLIALAVAFSTLLISASLAGSETILVKVFSLAPFREYGKLSYFLYLFHWPVMRICTLLLRIHDVPGTGRLGSLSGLVFFVGALILPLIPAWISWHLFEKQILKLKRYFPS
jgi:peptidoglycan/LPS O-acetylase OafA/YrhL